MARFLPSWYNFDCVLARSRYKLSGDHKFVTVQDLVRRRWCSVAAQVSSEPVICHGAEFSGGQMRVSGYNSQQDLSKKQKPRKNRDKFINTTVRVSNSDV